MDLNKIFILKINTILRKIKGKLQRRRFYGVEISIFLIGLCYNFARLPKAANRSNTIITRDLANFRN